MICKLETSAHFPHKIDIRSLSEPLNKKKKKKSSHKAIELKSQPSQNLVYKSVFDVESLVI